MSRKVAGLHTRRGDVDLNAIDVLVPGPIAVNSATYVGQLFGGFSGAFVTTLAVSIPSMIFVPLYMKYEKKIQSNQWMSLFLAGVKNASVGLIFAVGLTIILETVFGISSIVDLTKAHIEWFPLSIFALALFTHLKWQVNPIIITLGAGVAGYFLYYVI